MLKKQYYTVAFFAIFSLSANMQTTKAQTTKAQTTWSLEKCVQYAADNNLQLKQSALQVGNAVLQQAQAKAQQMPTVNGSFQPSLNLGRSVDPTSNSFANQTIFSNSYSVSGNYTLYAGGTIKNGIKQADIDIAASKADAATVLNNIALSVAQAYLNVLQAEDNLKAANENLAQTKRQLTQIQKFINAGSLPAGNRLDLEAAEAANEQMIVQGENVVAAAYLSLKMLMNAPMNDDFLVEHLEIAIPADNLATLTATNLYEKAIATQPQIQAADLRRKSAEVTVAIANGRGLPTVQTFGSLRTNYSSLGKQLAGIEQGTAQYFGDLYIPASPTAPENYLPLLVRQPKVVLENTPYFKQIADNFSTTVGISVSIPIYQGRQVKIATERAKLQVQLASVQAEQTKRQLNNDVTLALANAKAAQKVLQAAQKTLKARELAYANSEKRFAAGAANSFELSTAQSVLDNARLNVIEKKYDYLFKLKIVDFYQGIPIKL
ncbi:MAG: hypothetical protein RI894_1701 [Bacteroidota bacterium]|jgi:outer membrane protein